MPENTSNWTQLTYPERCEIERLLDANASVSEIAARLSRSVSSVTREIRRNRRDDGYRSSPVSITRLCAHAKTCQVKGLCERCWRKRCASCRDVKCTNICKRYVADVCERNTRAPFCCNGCSSAPGCRRHRYHYSANLAQKLAEARLRDSRSGIDTTSEEFLTMMETARPLIRDRGQSVAHVFAAHPEFPCSERTFYRYVDLGLGGMKNLDLPASCRYRPRKRHQASRFKVPEGHRYEDFRALPEEDILSVVELDCVEGVKTDSKVLLTMFVKRISFLFVFVLPEHTQAAVEEVIDSLHALLGERFSSTFPLLLTDCGHEFQDFRAIEKGGRTKLYYCEPRRADQKGSIENCHKILRRIVPKGASIDGLTKADASLIASHVNSMPRPALGGASPFDLAVHMLPRDLLEGLGLEHIAPDDVVLKPSLLERN